jgi:ribonuclease P/MRP protein subunit POP5
MTKFRVKSTQKENWRYIAFELITKSKFSEKDIVRAIINSILRLLGEAGASETNMWLIEYNPTQLNGIIRCSHKALTKVIGSITTVTSINENTAAFNVLGVSGTIKKAKQKYLNTKI